MDNNWQVNKHGSTWQSTADTVPVVAPSPVSQVQALDSTRNSMINSSHYSYPHMVQEPCSSTRKMVADPLFQTTNYNLYNSSMSVMGTPFFTLLSGPPSFSQYDSQQVNSSKSFNPSSKVNFYNSSSIVVPKERDASFGSPKLSSQNIDNRYLKSKIDISPVVSIRTLASEGGSTSHGIEQFNGLSSLKAASVSGPTPVQCLKLQESPVPHQLSPLTSGLPRVFCLYASGDLFLTNSGLLGVVCSCHGLHMSISKFSEHSGLRDVNPGDAVHVDNGETIAQWRKVYFSKFRINLPEDQHGWHWPEGFSTAADSVKHRERISNVTKIAALSNSVGPPRPFPASRQPMIFPEDHHSKQILVNAHDNFNLPNGFTEASQSNVHSGVANKIIDQHVSPLSNSKLAGGTNNAFQSSSTYIDPIHKTKSSFTSQQILQNLRSPGKDSDKFKNSRDGDTLEKSRVTSNIELRLGQPSQQSQSSGKSNLPVFNTHVSRVGNPLGLVSSQPVIYNGCNKITEESTQVVNCAAQAAKSGLTDGHNRLGFGAFSKKTTLQPEQLKGSVNSMLFSQFESLKNKMQTKDSYDGSMNFGCNINNSTKVKFGSSVIENYKLMDIEKVELGGNVKFMGHPNSSFGFSKTNCDQSSQVQIYSNTPVDHSFSRPVTLRPMSPRPPLLSGTPSIVFSSMVVNSSPNMTSTMSKEEATRVMNSHTPSSKQAVKYSNQKDQNVPGNRLNENLRCSINLPSKTTERRDGYKVASKYNLPKLGMKSVQSGTTSWTAGGAEKSAVISVQRETSFQIRESGVQNKILCDPYQTGPPPPRIGLTGDICSSSGHGNGCQGTSCTYVPDKCNCWVQKNSMFEKNSNLEGNKFLSAFGEPSQIRASILYPSNLDKSCSLHDKSISSGRIEETMKPNLKKVEFNTFQWKDVPSKTSDQHAQKDDCMKEQVMSNISSKCSAPALTQGSVKISNGDSCTDDAQNTDCAKNFAVDEGSGIQKSWSSDDALDSSSNSGFDGLNCKNNSKNETNKAVSDRSTRSLVDELRVIDSLRLKKVQNLHNRLPMHESTSLVKTFEKDFEVRKRKRERKFKILCTSFPASPVSSVSIGSSGQSSQSLEDVPKLDKNRKVYVDCFEIPESSRGKNVSLNSDISKTKHVWKQEMPCKRITRPVVCGMYGIISNGDTSKPAKIFSLQKIIKTTKRCPAGNKVVKKSPVKTVKKPIVREGNRHSGKKCNLKEDLVFSDDDSMETSDSDFDTRTRRKSKETRKRSIYELIMEGKDSDYAAIPKNVASIPQDNLKNGENSNYLQEVDNVSRSPEELTCKSTPDVDTFCNVCGNLNKDEMNCLLECNRCLIKVHQACYGISKVPKSSWHCRPCRENATNMVCVLCGYEGGVMTRAVQSSNIVKSLLKAWNVGTESQENRVDPMVKNSSYPINDTIVVNSITSGFIDSTVTQWVHMVCGLWTPGTRCPNVDTMSAFDVSGACYPEGNVVCSMCKRSGGCCIRCRVVDCAIHFHPWCAHQKGLLQSEVEGAENDQVGFYGRCELHATEDRCNRKTNSRSLQVASLHDKETCARTEGYKGRKREGFRHDSQQNSSVAGGCLVRQEQVDAWNHINRQILSKRRLQRTTQTVQDVEHDFRKEYARYKQSKTWKHLVVYKSGIHALGLYTSLFISQSAMVVEYVGEIVGLRIADRREIQYQSGKQLQYKSACYFFRIDKEHIIDATRKGGIARFVNHSCQPNCVAKVITVRGEKKVVFFAERDIYPGEEITYDYHFNNEDEGKKILCSCNSNNCRRYLN